MHLSLKYFFIGSQNLIPECHMPTFAFKIRIIHLCNQCKIAKREPFIFGQETILDVSGVNGNSLFALRRFNLRKVS